MITLRYKPLASGKFSVYLDCYDEQTKQRRYDFLKLYVTKDYSKTRKIILPDAGYMKQATELFLKAKEKYQNTVRIGTDRSLLNEAKHKNFLIRFIEHEYENNHKEPTRSLLRYIKAFLKAKDVKLAKLSLDTISAFYVFLLHQLASSTAIGLLILLRSYLREAVKQGFIDKNPFEGFCLPKRENEERPYLLEKEVKQLEDTPTDFNVQIRDSFFFSLHSGLRWNDVKKLRQKQGNVIKKGKREIMVLKLQHLQSDNKSYTIELSEKAGVIVQPYLDKKKELVFDRLPNKPNCNKSLHLWGALAGLERNPCFSMARNTYAMRLLQKGKKLKEVKTEIGVINLHSIKIYKKMAEAL